VYITSFSTANTYLNYYTYFHIALNNNNLNFFHLERDGIIITTNYYNQLCGVRFSLLLNETIPHANRTKRFTNLLTINIWAFEAPEFTP